MNSLLLIMAALTAWLLAGFEALLARRMLCGRWRWRLLLEPARSGWRHLHKGWRPTERPDLALWRSAPLLLLALPLALLPLLPPGPAADAPTGLVVAMAIIAFVSPAQLLAGWGPNSKFPLFGGLRFVGLVLACEMPFAIAVLTCALPARSLALADIVAVQEAGYWNLVVSPIGFAIYLVCALALAFRGPFALTASADLAGGVEAELSGPMLALWRLGRALLLAALAAFGTVLFLGGGTGPLLPPLVWLGFKSLLLGALLVALGELAPLVRLDRFMRMGWVWLLPVALLNLFLTGLLLIAGTGRMGAVP